MHAPRFRHNWQAHQAATRQLLGRFSQDYTGAKKVYRYIFIRVRWHLDHKLGAEQSKETWIYGYRKR